MSFRDFDKWHRPKRGWHIRITTAALGAIGLKVATWLGNRRERKRKAQIERIKEARRNAHR